MVGWLELVVVLINAIAIMSWIVLVILGFLHLLPGLEWPEQSIWRGIFILIISLILGGNIIKDVYRLLHSYIIDEVEVKIENAISRHMDIYHPNQRVGLRLALEALDALNGNEV